MRFSAAALVSAGLCPKEAAAQRPGFDPGFFATFLAKEYVGAADRNGFRWFLRVPQHFLANQRDRARAQKRGGGKTHIPLTNSRRRTATGLTSHELTADKLYDRGWALTVLEEARSDCAKNTQAGKRERFEHLNAFFPASKARDLLRPPPSLIDRVRVNPIHRLKSVWRTLRSQIAETVAEPSEIDDELRHLITILSE